VVFPADGTCAYEQLGGVDALGERETEAVGFVYRLSTVRGRADTDTVSITIEGVNDDPTARDDFEATDADTAVSGNLVDGSSGGLDDDPEGDPITVVSVDGDATSGAPIELASGALVTFESDGEFTYDPNGAFDDLFAGAIATDTFTYEISDGNGGVDTATVEVEVVGTVTLIEGTPGSDLLSGTDNMDIIRPLGGRIDQMAGGAAMDIFDLRDTVNDGILQVRYFLDYEAGVDLIATDGLGAANAFEAPGRVTTIMEGDGDIYVVFGVDTLNDIVFV